MDSSQIEAGGRQVLGIGKVHARSTFTQVYARDSRYVAWVLSEPRTGRLGTFATWCQQKKRSSIPPAPAAAPASPAPAGPRHIGTPPTVRYREISRDIAATTLCRVHKCGMRGPLTVKKGTHNIGRQFYSCAYNGTSSWAKQRREEDGKTTDCGVDGFVWADGSDAFSMGFQRCFSASSCRRAERHHGAPRNSIGVGVQGPGGDVVGDELSRGPSGFRSMGRGGVLRNAQARFKRRRDDTWDDEMRFSRDDPDDGDDAATLFGDFWGC